MVFKSRSSPAKKKEKNTEIGGQHQFNTQKIYKLTRNFSFKCISLIYSAFLFILSAIKGKMLSHMTWLGLSVVRCIPAMGRQEFAEVKQHCGSGAKAQPREGEADLQRDKPGKTKPELQKSHFHLGGGVKYWLKKNTNQPDLNYFPVFRNQPGPAWKLAGPSSRPPFPGCLFFPAAQCDPPKDTAALWAIFTEAKLTFAPPPKVPKFLFGLIYEDCFIWPGVLHQPEIGKPPGAFFLWFHCW